MASLEKSRNRQTIGVECDSLWIFLGKLYYPINEWVRRHKLRQVLPKHELNFLFPGFRSKLPLAQSGSCVRSQNEWTSAGSRAANCKPCFAASSVGAAIWDVLAPESKSSTTCYHFRVREKLPSRMCPMRPHF